jgi:hypothetical protein
VLLKGRKEGRQGSQDGRRGGIRVILGLRRGGTAGQFKWIVAFQMTDCGLF